jgi:RIO kinase 1
LKDSTLSSDELFACYKSIVINTRRMYHDCNLIHGDLSEYNLLWWNQQCYIIDVSQSVEQSHPLALEFLRKDLSNITDFFGKKGLTPLLSKVALFQFIVAKEPVNPLNNIFYENPVEMIEKHEYQEYLKKLEIKLDSLLEDSAINESENCFQNFSVSALNSSLDGFSSLNLTQQEENKKQAEAEAQQRYEAQQEVDEAVFLQSFIPTSLNEIANPYKEIELLKGGQREKIYSDAVMNMLGGAPSSDMNADNDDEDDDDESEDEEEILQSLIAKLSKPSGSSSETGMFAAESTANQEKKMKKKTKKSSADDETNDKPQHDSSSEEKEDDEGDGDEEDDDGDDDDDDGDNSQDEEDDDDDDEDVTASGKYRRTLPPRDLLAERLKEKEARKEAKKLTKEAKAAKRQNKIPKHVKKRAMKSGKK